MIKVLATSTIIAMLALFTQVYFASSWQNEAEMYQAKCDSLQHINDSLHSELLPAQIELGRYQVAYEIFAERNPKAASQYGDIISNETE
jgi:hypothetical protein